jgi:GNAT superfamily N-acetyltransferase
VTEASFAGSLLYRPMSEQEFARQYMALLPLVDPDLVLIAEHESETIGFLFAIPDVAGATPGRATDTVILKTVAVHPGWSGQGLGTLLGRRCHEIAREKGYRRAIHALMREDNTSGHISARLGARVIRRYVLYGRRLRG